MSLLPTARPFPPNTRICSTCQAFLQIDMMGTTRIQGIGLTVLSAASEGGSLMLDATGVGITGVSAAAMASQAAGEDLWVPEIGPRIRPAVTATFDSRA